MELKSKPMSTLPTLGLSLSPIIGTWSALPGPFPFPAPATLPHFRSNLPKYQQKATTAMAASPYVSCSDFVKDSCLLTFLAEKSIASASRFPGISPEIVLLELVLFLVHGREESEGILVYLASAEEREPDVWLKDDYRIAWLTVLYCANGRPTPWEWAFNQVVGGNPSKVIPQLVERARQHAVLGLPPKKSVVSVANVQAQEKRS
jgi:hypothetical protein